MLTLSLVLSLNGRHTHTHIRTRESESCVPTSLHFICSHRPYLTCPAPRRAIEVGPEQNAWRRRVMSLPPGPLRMMNDVE
jgi:hypothetical protein